MMKVTRRTFLTVLIVGLALLVSYTFRAFLLENLIRPVSLIFWMFWRLLLAIDQRLFWSVLLFVALIYGTIRLADQLLGEIQPPPAPLSNSTLANIEFWRTFFKLTSNEADQMNILKQKLLDMVVSVYTISEPDVPHWHVEEDLQERRIPLPENIYTFLFPPRQPAGPPSFRRRLQRLWNAPARWLRRRSGRAAADYNRSINEVLVFLETSLEIDHDN